ncbi:MAG: hypothetical protein AAFZ49_15280, partial [Cyanobacteria bacterium J06659_2]
ESGDENDGMIHYSCNRILSCDFDSQFWNVLSVILLTECFCKLPSQILTSIGADIKQICTTRLNKKKKGDRRMSLK